MFFCVFTFIKNTRNQMMRTKNCCELLIKKVDRTWWFWRICKLTICSNMTASWSMIKWPAKSFFSSCFELCIPNYLQTLLFLPVETYTFSTLFTHSQKISHGEIITEFPSLYIGNFFLPGFCVVITLTCSILL